MELRPRPRNMLLDVTGWSSRYWKSDYVSTVE
uniref:Uncharacterized protein n=1 Tax=Rhizophora mucronata TaxID=61149 RepID=A0A2P2Q6I5_RHIMU